MSELTELYLLWILSTLLAAGIFFIMRSVYFIIPMIAIIIMDSIIAEWIMD